MKPFLLLATRPEDDAAAAEYAGFLEAGGLAADELVHLRLEKTPLPDLRLEDYSGIIVGGSPFNTSDPVATKSDVQVRVEEELGALLDRVLEQDFPYLGACYGIGLVADRLGGTVDREWGESPGPTRVELTPEGERDQLFGTLTPTFDAFVGHKEACSKLPDGAVLLATGPSCPVQAFRVGNNVYATQFHPELTPDAFLTRIQVYKNSGYFEPSALGAIVDLVGASTVTEPISLVKAFVSRFS
jgi:GMP synthase (glutamine-hydrolysing)